MPTYRAVIRLLFALLVPALAASGVRAAPIEILVPAYMEPTMVGGVLDGPWRTLADGANQGRRISVILNPASGPGSLPPPTAWATASAAFRCDRCEDLLGFTSTRYGTRPIEEVKREIDAYYTHYPVTGIFLDELPSEADMLDVDGNGNLIHAPIWSARMAYYSELYQYIQSRGAPGNTRVVGNPGTRTVESFLTGADGYGRGADSLIVYENSAELLLGSPATSAYVPTPWNAASGYRDQLGYLVHTTSAAQLDSVLARIDANGGGIAFVTDGTDPAGPLDQRYTQLPSYWESLLAQAEVCLIPAPGALGLLLAGLLPIAWRRVNKTLSKPDLSRV